MNIDIPLEILNDESQQLKSIFEEIDLLEKECAPSGVGFAVAGQASSNSGKYQPGQIDPVEGAKTALASLKARKKMLESLDDEGRLPEGFSFG